MGIVEGVVAVDVEGGVFGVGEIDAAGLDKFGEVDVGCGLPITFAGEFAPDDEDGFALGVFRFEGEEAVLHFEFLEGEAHEVVEGLDEVDGGGLGLAGVGIVNLELAAPRVLEACEVHEVAIGLDIEHVGEEVVLLHGVIEAEEVGFLVLQLEIVQGVLVGFEAEVFEGMGNAGFRGGGLAVFPIGGVNDFLEAGFEDRVKVVAHFDEDVFAANSHLSLVIQKSVARGSRPRKIVQNGKLISTSLAEKPPYQFSRLRVGKYTM